ncbi:TonB-dependent receptor [Rhodocytophaga rosea]|uniref:TonB-dependent receptor n=1 Tax=Rhodocytophaga rosea TaxID=2704465 RepID=A0A6C0GC53_9BACT|nr:TonB-dependent receptor [Rhodocytophaga rosea]QHT65526.1 TonB-dependent receptor [Rhodocytophaga rosea]
MKRILLNYVVLLFALGISQSLYAQNRTVSGKVTSADDGTSLPGVNVAVKGTTIGTATDAEGNFAVSVPDNATLVFSFIGLTTQEIAVDNRSVLNVQMEADVQSLSEVVVIGYGSQQKRDLTGNIASVSGADIANVPVPSLEQAIQGRAAGVFIQSNNGKLGQGMQVRVRGSSSVTASNQPLYVIDGIPITSESQSSSDSQTNPLADLNFNDVESIEILKDASAAAIYGSRASNGVVLITTKKGKSGKTNFSLGYFTGFSDPTGKKEWLNSREYVELFNEARANSEALGIDPPTQASLDARFTRYSAGNAAGWQTPTINTDWQDQAFQRGKVNQVDLSASGGTDKTRFYISGSYSDQDGILIRNNFKRMSGRINLDHRATDKLMLGANFSLSRTVNTRLSNDNAFSTPMQVVALPPITPVIDPRTGQLSGNYTLYYNPLLNRDYSSNMTYVLRNISNVYASYDFLPGLTFRSEFGVDVLTQNEEQYYGKETVRNSSAPNGLGFNSWTQIFNYNTNNFFRYVNTFADAHDVEAILGMSYQESKRDLTSAEGQQFASNAYKQITSAADITSGNSEETMFSFLSYFSRVNYQLNKRYLLSVSGRIDGSSRFGESNRYGFFPAASVGWVISEESFLADNNLLSFLKLRASYGITGNAEIGNFAPRGLFAGDAGYAGTPGQRPSQIENPDLKWEQTAQTDIGIDFGFFKGRISGEVDYYVKKTKDLLLDVNVPATSGFTTQLRNVGKLENKGIEVVINTQNLTGAFTWNTSFNFSRNRNKLTDLQGQIIEGGYVNRAVEGQPIGVFFAPEYAGVDVENGDALYYVNTARPDGSRDRTTTNDVNEAQRVIIGNPNPDFTAGITNTFSYKGIDLTFLFQGVYGNDVYNAGGKFQSANGDFFDNQTKDQLNRWQKPGDVTSVPQARLYGANGTAESSRYLSDASYTRLKTITLGYSLPNVLVNKLKLQRVRIYATGQNLLTFTDYNGWDPEVNADFIASGSNIGLGTDFYSAPQPRTITFGINLGF